MRSFHTKIVGVTFDNPNGQSRQSVIHDLYVRKSTPFILDMELDHDNPYDQNAVAVYTSSGTQIGFLSKSVANQVSKWLRQGADIKATATQITGGRGYNYGINLLISENE